MSKLTWRGNEVKEIAHEAAIKAGRTAMEDILTAAIDEAPLLSGTMRRSGTVTVGGLPPDPNDIYESAKAGADQKGTFPGELGSEKVIYGSFNTPYAIKQHEDMGLRHKDGKAKYLEDPFNRKKAGAVSHIKAEVNKALRNGGRMDANRY